MPLRINDTAPDFTAETTQGPIHFHEWIGNGYAISVLPPEGLHTEYAPLSWLYGRACSPNSSAGIRRFYSGLSASIP